MTPADLLGLPACGGWTRLGLAVACARLAALEAADLRVVFPVRAV